MEQPELQWLSEYRYGNTEALGKLVEHFRRPLFAFINRMMEGHVDAEEIFQEVWLRAIRNLHSFREDRFLSWLFRIAHNLVIDRARKRRPVVDVQAGATDEESFVEDRMADRRVGPDGLAAAKDLGVKINSAILRLPVEQREVFLLRTEGDVPFKDIARMQGVSINTALARMQYALAKLRSDLAADYEILGRS